MTLDRVKMDLSGCFEHGQVYVAVSRATSLEGVQICGLEASRVKCDPRVLRYLQELDGELPAGGGGTVAPSTPAVAAPEEEGDDDDTFVAPSPSSSSGSYSSSTAAAAAIAAAAAATDLKCDWMDDEEEVNLCTPAPAAAAVATSRRPALKRSAPPPITDTEVLTWFAKQHNTTIEHVRWEAKKKLRV
jgi:hypothetical protein